MITINELLVFVYVFITTFLLHELMHIKGEGITTTGRIFVYKTGFACSDNNTTHLLDGEWMYYSGGVLTSLILFIILVLNVNNSFTFSILTCGWIQLIYGIYEGFTQGKYKGFRYIIYITVFLFWLIMFAIVA